MNIAILGSGGREHAICDKLKQSKSKNKLFCLPGNAGTSNIATNINCNILDFKETYKIVKKHKIKLIIVGPEQPLVDGIVDFFKSKKIKIFGPDKFCSNLEGSKHFTKKICDNNNIPTAKYGFFDNFNKAKNFINKNKIPIVIKADGLASGKGVYICKSKRQAIKSVKEVLSGKFKSSSKVLLEEFLEGEEMSYFIIADKNNFKFFGTAQDHKRVGENDTGLNTGGMGAYSPSAIINNKLESKIIEKIIKPTLKTLKEKKHPYKGFLYVGLMIVKNEPYLIEYNVRMGDPECQTIMTRLDTDFLNIIKACVNNNLHKIKIKWKNEQSICVVLCSKGYPKKHIKNIEIKNINKINLNKNEFIFHAGTYLKHKKTYSAGGRVLNIISTSKKLQLARKNIFKIIKELKWSSGFYRKDIGWRAINTIKK